jgi:hypothetical protein
MTPSHLTVSSHRQPRCRWPCTGLRSICRGERRELDETREERIRLQKGEERGEDPTSHLVGEEHARTHLGVLYRGDGRGEGVGVVGLSQRTTMSRFLASRVLY